MGWREVATLHMASCVFPSFESSASACRVKGAASSPRQAEALGDRVKRVREAALEALVPRAVLEGLFHVAWHRI